MAAPPGRGAGDGTVAASTGRRSSPLPFFIGEPVGLAISPALPAATGSARPGRELDVGVSSRAAGAQVSRFSRGLGTTSRRHLGE